MTATELCEMCGHEAGPHVLLAHDPMKGGIRRCPEEGCECHATWSPQGVAPPDDGLVQELIEAWTESREVFVSTPVTIPGIVPVGDSWVEGDRC